MDLFSRVVVGVDGTEWGYEALRQAVCLSDSGVAVVRAVTALDTSVVVHSGFQAPHFAELLEEEAATARDAAEAMMANRPGCDARVVRGRPLDVLRHERDALGATLLALGGRRSSRFLGIVLGDTGTELVHDAACSTLLAYPAEEGPWQPRRIVVGLDGSAHAAAALRTADALAVTFGGAVEVLSATGGKAVESEGAWSKRVQTWHPGSPVGALVERSQAADLIVVGSRGAHGVGAIGSVSERVAHQAACTVLIIHET